MLPHFPRRFAGMVLLLLITFIVVSLLVARSGVRAEAMKPPVVLSSSMTIRPLAPASSQPEFGYGLVMADSDGYAASLMGFNWIMEFNFIDYSPAHVLRRVKVDALDLANLPALSDRMSKITGSTAAIQIGNEPNLSSEWGAPPDAAKYRQVLCAAYTAIKQINPDTIVVSGGLAPTGRVPGIWNGHLGSDGLKQDEREFLK